MNKPAWLNFKNVWWFLIVIAVSFFLFKRYDSLINGESTVFDVFIFLIWITLLLYPLFQEMNFWGLSFKKEVEKIKSEMVKNISELKSDIRSEIQLSNSFTPVFNLPPSESKLPQIETQIKNSLEQYLRERGLKPDQLSNKELNVDEDVNLMFKARHNIEKELRRIWEERIDQNERRRNVPIHNISGRLVQEGLIDQRIHHMIREVYSVASPAIHGEDVSQYQVDFVKDVAPDIVATLRTIS